jgi:beta-exotoxin I transport system ATP-binding protein
MATAAIETTHLTKRYGRLIALDDLSLRVDAGEVFGFLGPNGAGKTTTIRLLLGLITAAGGSATVLGRDVAVSGADWRQDIGYLPGDLLLWPGLSGRTTLEFLARLTGRPAVWREELLERLQFSTADLDRRVRTYSDGMRQKIGIIQALQCAPKLVLLDEPTKGLDPLVQQAFYDILKDLAKRGTTVFFSSHVLPEVERVCTRVAMLRRGQLVTSGSLDDLRGTLPRRVVITFTEDVDTSRVTDLGRVVVSQARHLEMLIPADRIPGLVNRLAALPLGDLRIEAPGLEDAFLERYR